MDPQEQQLPRKRADIEAGINHGRAGADNSVVENLATLAEILLDVRDAVHELCVIMSRNESNTEAVAIRAETVIPHSLRAQPPIAEVCEVVLVGEVNKLLGQGWTVLSAGTDPHGVTHFAMGRRTAA